MTDEAFTHKNDIAALQAYLNRAGNDEKIAPPSGYATVTAIIEVMSQLRIAAESAYRTQPWTARDNRRELPLRWEDAYEQIFNAEQGPPSSTITMIAEQFLPELMLLLSNLRRVLRRERQMVQLSQARQLDVQCMRWMTRQPGSTVADKAGARQRIMAVVRNESVDTPENRVLKSFLLLCQRTSSEYLRKFGDQFCTYERVRKIRDLLALVTEALANPEMLAVSTLGTLPPPNYVLRYDPLYSAVWQWYIRLLRQQQLVIAVWPYREHLLDEFMRLCLAVQLHHTYSNICFHDELWLSFMPSYGRFLRHCTWNNCFWLNANNRIIVYSGEGDAFPLLHWRRLINNKPQNAHNLLFVYDGIVTATNLPRDGKSEYVRYITSTSMAGEMADELPIWHEADDLSGYMTRLFHALQWGK